MLHLAKKEQTIQFQYSPIILPVSIILLLLEMVSRRITFLETSLTYKNGSKFIHILKLFLFETPKNIICISKWQGYFERFSRLTEHSHLLLILWTETRKHCKEIIDFAYYSLASAISITVSVYLLLTFFPKRYFKVS